MSAVVSGLRWWTGLIVLWIVLVGSTAWVELVAGAVAAALGTAAALALGRLGMHRYSVDPHLALRTWRLAWDVPREFALLVLVLVKALAGRPVEGRYRAIPFPAGGSDRRSAGRRAFVTVAGTVAPNSIVVDVDRERDLALIHDLDAEGARAEPL
jgi:multisubunit Na+/H+ antiporter MnhE subunit